MSLLTKVSRLYHVTGLRQPEIAERLHISQSRVSRLLKEAVRLGIVRTIVVPPAGVHPELEESVREKYGIRDVMVADSASSSEQSTLAALGGAGAAYLETTLTGNDHVGISSWSSSLLATVDAMSPKTTRTAEEIIQLLGGVGNPVVQVKATHLTDRLAHVTGASPKFLPVPGIVASKAGRDILMQDLFVQEVVRAWKQLTVVLVGIGSIEPSPLLKDSGNTLSVDDATQLQGLGAVGDVCLRFFDKSGALVDSDVDERVLGISVADLLRVPRRVGVAAGERKYEAIKAALLGGWVDVLITDIRTAEWLVAN